MASNCKHCGDCQGVNGHHLDSRCLTEFDQRKLAAIIRHFGMKINDEEDAYMLEIPLKEAYGVPVKTTVIPADNPDHATIGYVCFTRKDDAS